MLLQALSKIPILILGLCISGSTFAGDTSTTTKKAPDKHEIYLHADSFSYSETAPIKQMLDELKGSEFDGGSYSFTHNELEVGIRYRNWRLATVARYDYYLAYNPDTAEILYRDKNNLQIDTLRAYNIDLQAIHTRASGLKLGYQQQWQNFSIALGATWLRSDQLTDGVLRGVIAVDQNDYSGDIAIDYVYDQPLFFKRNQSGSASGQGSTLNVQLSWDINERFIAAVSLKDLYSRIKFNRAPFTTASATSNRVGLTADGRIETKPALSGVLGARKHEFEYPKQYKIAVQTMLDDKTTAVASLLRFEAVNFPALGLRRKLNNNSLAELHYDFQSQAVSLVYAATRWQLALSSDSLQYKKAKMLALRFSWQVGT